MTKAIWPAKLLASCCLLVAVSACETELISRPPAADKADDGGENTPTTARNAQVGLGYHLGMTQFDITITRRVGACDPGKQPEVSTKLEAVARKVADPHQRYFVDYSEMASGNKTTAVTITLNENRTLKSINAESDDRTAEIAKNIITSAAKVALIAGGAPPLPGLEALAVNVCTNDVMDALQIINNECAADGSATPTGCNATKHLSSEVTQRTLELDRALLVATHPGTPSDDAIKAIQTAKANLADAEQKLEAHKAQLAKFTARITDSETIVWPKNGTDIAKTFAWPGRLTRQWFLADAVVPKDAQDSTAGTVPVGEWLEQNFALAMSLEPLTEAKREACKTGSSCLQTEPFTGVVYREPADARLSICRAALVPSGGAEDTASADSACAAKLLEKEMKIEQLGTLAVLPIENEWLQDNAFAFLFDESGTPTQIEFKQTNAPLEDASGVLAFAAETGLDVRNELALSELRKLQLEGATLEERKKIENALQELDTGGLKDLELQNKILTEQIAIAENQRKLAEAKARAALPLDSAETLEELETAKDEIEAEVALIKARIALAEANRRLAELQQP